MTGAASPISACSSPGACWVDRVAPAQAAAGGGARRRRRTGATRLVILAADRHIEAAVTGLLSRSRALGARPPTFQPFRHPNSDSGCLVHAHEFLRSQSNRFDHALVLFDRQGCGRERQERERLEADVEGRLEANGWAGRAAVVVLDPEIEAWVWSPSESVDEALGWKGRAPALRPWLLREGLLVVGEAKPRDPKRAVERALELVRKPRSSSIYQELARVMPIAGCQDPAFHKLVDVLTRWFPASRA